MSDDSSPVGASSAATCPASATSAVPESTPVGDGPPNPLAVTRRQVDRLKEQLHRLQRTMRLAIEQTLAEWAGQSFGSLEANREMTSTIHAMLEGHGLRVACPECGHPAILRCGPRPGLPNGVFVFDHVIGGRRTFHGGGTTLPGLRLVAKPPRKRAGSHPMPDG